MKMRFRVMLFCERLPEVPQVVSGRDGEGCRRMDQEELCCRSLPTVSNGVGQALRTDASHVIKLDNLMVTASSFYFFVEDMGAPDVLRLCLLSASRITPTWKSRCQFITARPLSPSTPVSLHDIPFTDGECIEGTDLRRCRTPYLRWLD